MKKTIEPDPNLAREVYCSMTIRNKGKFKKGTSGNPTGRPPGSRNKATRAMEELLEGESLQILRKIIEKAKKGDAYAGRLCLERIYPARKERSITLALQPVGSPKDLPKQYQGIISAVGDGSITPGEGEAMSNILTNLARSFETVETDQRIAKLEDRVADVAKYQRELDQFVQKGLPNVPPALPGDVMS